MCGCWTEEQTTFKIGVASWVMVALSFVARYAMAPAARERGVKLQGDLNEVSRREGGNHIAGRNHKEYNCEHQLNKISHESASIHFLLVMQRELSADIGRK